MTKPDVKKINEGLHKSAEQTRHAVFFCACRLARTGLLQSYQSGVHGIAMSLHLCQGAGEVRGAVGEKGAGEKGESRVLENRCEMVLRRLADGHPPLPDISTHGNSARSSLNVTWAFKHI